MSGVACCSPLVLQVKTFLSDMVKSKKAVKAR